MAAANYQSSKETTNFARICRLVIDVIPDLFRDLLIARLASTGLTYVLTNQKGQVFPLLNRQQKKILYPQGGLFQGSVKDLDTSLLYILLRNLGNIPPHQNGWGKVPGIADRSLSANIDRLREQRNEAYAHAPNASLSDGEFQARWDIIRQSVEEIQNSELNTGRFVVAVDTTFTMRMDPSTEKNFITLIAQIEGEMSDIKERQVATTADVDNLKGKMAGMSEKQGAMQTDMAGMSVKQEAMQTDMAGMSVKQDAMQTDMAGMSVKQDAMQTDMADLQGHIREEFGAVRGAVGAVRDAVGAVKEQLNISANRGRDPKMSALIETTTARIMNEKEYKYTPTKSFSDARKKLMKNRVVVIKGNSGDGKTSIALELLRLLCHDVEEGQQRRKPLELHDIKDFDLVAPMSQLVIYLDDIFGKNVVRKQDVEEWEKRVESVIESKLCGNEHAKGNFLIITIRSGIFNSLSKSCLEKVFTEQNIVELNIVAKEKLGLLKLYKPKENFVSWKESEEKEIVKCAPDIGFPQCCRLFRDSPALQTERVNFFKRPFHFLKSSLSKLEDGKCYGLMYLFLNGGKIMEDDLDSHNENIDQNVLKAAFEDDVVEVTPTTELVYNKGRKIEFVKESLDSLLDWLVKKEPNDEQRVCYQFNHDSIEETVALLYGEKTPIGYIQNCPSKFLSYVTTSKTTPNMVVISSDNQYNVLYKRLLREFKSVYSTKCKSERFYSKCHSITSLDVWTDIQFLQGFIRWLSGQNVDKSLFCRIKFACIRCQSDKNVDKNLCNEIRLALLNGACSSGSEECVSFLLSEGVKPEKETLFCVVEGGSMNILYKVEGFILQSYKEKCETVEGHVVHKNCVFAQHMCRLVNERGRTMLHSSCLFGHMEVCKYLCESYPALTTAVDNNGRTVLHYSCRWGHMEVCKYLFELYPALTTAVDKYGGTVLHYSCLFGHMEVCKYLCESYPALTTGVTNNGQTVLHYSCLFGHMEVCKYLFESYPALTTAVDNNGKTVLHYSCLFGHMEVCEYLCELYPALTTAVTNNGATVLHYSCYQGHMEVCKYLCESYPALTTAVDKYGGTVLHSSCDQGHMELCKYLCESYPALTTAVNNDGKTVLHSSCYQGHMEVCKYLCQSYPALTTAVIKNGLTVLHYSCSWGHMEVCKYLCESYPALTTAVDNNGLTVLHYSCMFGHMEVCKYLCQSYPALTTAVDNNGLTVLHYSCSWGHMEVCKYLCESYPALTTAVNKYGQTVLHSSCLFGHMEVCKYLCESYPALTTAVNNDGRTVLHSSCYQGHMEVCKYLCQSYPALTTAVIKNGLTVLHYSCSWGHMEVCKYLCESYPALTTAVDNNGWHCLHYIARYTSDVDLFTECETHVKRYLESTGRKYDITTILTNQGRSVLDFTKVRGTGNNPLYEHLVHLFGKKTHKIF